MNNDGFRAERGIAGAVIFLMVGKRVARSSQEALQDGHGVEGPRGVFRQ
jgi:hypothetical protein